MTLLFEIAHEHSADMLSKCPKHKEDVLYLMEEIYVLDKLCLGLSYSAVDHEFKVNESKTYN